MTGPRRVRLWWLVLTFLGGVATAMVAEELILRAQGNRLEFQAPGLHYLTGRPLSRMKNSEAVAFDFHVRLSDKDSKIVRESAAQFVVSYALWDDRFKVVRVLPGRKDSPKGLTANEAEAWCVKEMSLDTNGIAGNQLLTAYLEIRGPGERERPLFSKPDDDGISLRGLIDKFSRLPQASQPHWELKAEGFTLDQLRRGE